VKIDGPFTMIDFATSPKDTMTGKLIDPDLPRRFVKMCCRYDINFIRGSTQPAKDFEELERLVENSNINAVIAPNMAPPIVAFQNMIKNFTKIFDYLAPNHRSNEILNGCRLDIVESHQSTKTDTSGTARAMIEKPNGEKGYFNLLGTPYKESDIIMIRERKEYSKLGIPEKYFNGHGWHNYIFQRNSGKGNGIDLLINEMKHFLRIKTEVFSDYGLNSKLENIKELNFVINYNNLELTENIGKDRSIKKYMEEFNGIMPSIDYLEYKIGKKIDVTNAMIRISKDKTVGFGLLYKPKETAVIIHNVNGREVYGTGVVKALDFLTAAVARGEKGKVYNMMDALRLK
jgi:dihydrodipicolinate reductase